ncbi:MAG: sigma-70 family RNA polymerase sigma factor [Phycisphaerales bacterium]|nr:MAG: sigma-70 family RNA polymerase sigma factor [Phycisphaerales bacterium]
MFDKAVTYDLFWDPTASEAVEADQQWILTAMQKHGPELVTMLWRILGNEQDVCDAYQTTFLRLAHRQGAEKPRQIRAYLFRTASNAAITMLRRRMTETRALSDMEDSSSSAGTAESDFDTHQLSENLRRYIAELPDHLRSVVTLRDLGELPYCEVARIMGVSTGTARVYRCKAVQLLAAWMSKED